MLRSYPEIIQFAKENNIKPTKLRGQNFLIDPFYYEDIVEAAEVNKDDLVLEVGPGLGGLTDLLCESAKNVFAVELDKTLFFHLKQNFKEYKNLTLLNEDVMSSEFYSAFTKWLEENKALENYQYKIVANIPYTITSNFIRTFLEYSQKPSQLTLMVQKEVAQRIVAAPGDMSILSVSVQYYANAGIIKEVPAELFWPKPKVDSAILRIDLNQSFDDDKESVKHFFRIVKMGFAAKRKQLHKNLSSGTKKRSDEIKKLFNERGLSQTVRAQELSVDDWKWLSDHLR